MNIKIDLKMIIIVVIAIFSISIIAWYLNNENESKIAINDVSFVMTNERMINATVINNGLEEVELQKLYINGIKVLPWYAEKILLKPNDKTNLTIHYVWKSREEYTIKLIADKSTTQKIVKAPVVHTTLNFKIYNLSKTGVNYQLNTNGLSNVKVMTFLYKRYESSSKQIYVFYDHNYMPKETLISADSFIDLANKYGMNVKKVNWFELDAIAENKEPGILVLFNPLVNATSLEINAALPSSIIDRNNDGSIRDDSKYGKSYVYDWMHDNGLIFVTVNSTNIHLFILYKNGTSSIYSAEWWAWSHSGLYLTDANSDIQYLGFGKPLKPLKIEDTLGLREVGGPWGFVEEWLNNYSLQYYPYGYFILERDPRLDNKTVHTYLPCFIRVGKGGWLEVGNPILKVRESNDLVMMLLHSSWNSEWLPNGWNYDSGLKTYEVDGGILSINDTISTGGIPENIKGDLTLRILVTAFDPDNDHYILKEKLVKITR